MLYRLVEHYDTNYDYIYDCSASTIIEKNNIENAEHKECFVCLDTNIIQETPIQLKNQILYLKICLCDGYIHNSCLKKWCNVKSTCPICRINIIQIPSLKTRIMTYIMRNNTISFICVKSNVIYNSFTNNAIIKKIVHFFSLFTFFFIFTCIYAEIIQQIINKYDTNKEDEIGNYSSEN